MSYKCTAWTPLSAGCWLAGCIHRSIRHFIDCGGPWICANFCCEVIQANHPQYYFCLWILLTCFHRTNIAMLIGVYEFDDTVVLKADGSIQKGRVCVCMIPLTLSPLPSVSCAAETARTFLKCVIDLATRQLQFTLHNHVNIGSLGGKH